MKLKYILTQSGQSGAFVLFHPITAHNDMAKGLFGTPISAGFCYIEVQGEEPTSTKETRPIVKCFGESISLGLKSRPEDSEIITKAINNPY